MNLVLLLSVIFIFGTNTCSAEVQATFGCEFDSNYNLLVPANGTNVDSRVNIHWLPTPLAGINNHVQPVWGEGNVGIVTFESEHRFNAFLLALREINALVVQSNQYNTIVNLLTFYNEYQKTRRNSNLDMHLNEFFVQHKETDKPVDGANLTIKMVNEMIVAYPQYAVKMLTFASLSTCVSGDFGNLTEEQLSVEPHLLPVKNYNDRVMGFLRFKIRRGNMGYVVMDPSHALKDVIVIWDSDTDGKVSLGITRDPMKEIKFWHKYQKKGDYIEVTSSFANFQSQTMCYIGKSFCSFENASRKTGLVMPFHSMVVYSDNWDQRGGLFVNLYETDKYDGRVALWGSDIIGGPTVLKFENIKQLYELLKEDQKRQKLDEVAKAFGKTPEEMEDLLAKIGIMFNDRVFMFQMKRLYDWFSQDSAKQVTAK